MPLTPHRIGDAYGVIVEVHLDAAGAGWLRDLLEREHGDRGARELVEGLREALDLEAEWVRAERGG